MFSDSWLLRKSNLSWFAAGRKHMFRVIVLATGENIQGASWGRAAAAYRGMPKPNDNDSTDLSVGVKVFKQDQKQPPTVMWTTQTNWVRGEMMASVKILTGWWRKTLESRGPGETHGGNINEAERGKTHSMKPADTQQSSLSLLNVAWKWI